MSAGRTGLKQAKAVFIVSSGNFLEMYDFMVFGFYATAIAGAFFPKASPFAALMLSLMTFGAGFLMRPVGALVLGAVLDRHGRRTGLLITLGLMAVGTFSIALAPPYVAIGLAAPLLVLVGRLVQGFSAGVELGGVSVYLSEIAPPHRKGFFVAWQSASQQVAVMSAALIGIAATGALGPEAMKAWGWRIPFLIGCAVIPFLFLIRSHLEETPAFAAREDRPRHREIAATVAANWGLVLLGMMMATMTTVTFYMITSYTPTYGTTELHLSPVSGLAVSLCVGAANFVLLPAFGALSDRIGRAPILLTATALSILTSYPALHWMVARPSFGALLAVELWLALIYAAYNGAMVVFLTEVMPERVRTSGFSLAYSLATAIFGGFTPAIAHWLIHVTGDKAAPGGWLSAAALLGFTAALTLSRRQKAQGVGAPGFTTADAAPG